MTNQQTGVTPDQELAEFRAAKDELMRSDPHSPIPEGDRNSFHGLRYYAPNNALRFTLPLDRDVSEEPVEMETSTGGTRAYRRAGKIHFEVEGAQAELTIYAADGSLFLPLRDATSATETYPAGRYLEPEPLGDGRVLVDFNYLYNPYCAYDDVWSCPVPPVENWLQVPIRAGELRFHP